jgi:hypothetical protein
MSEMHASPAAGARSAAASVCVQALATLRAPCRKRPIRDLSPSACLPFQARGQVPDWAPATSECLPFQALGKAMDRPPAMPVDSQFPAQISRPTLRATEPLR